MSSNGRSPFRKYRLNCEVDGLKVIENAAIVTDRGIIEKGRIIVEKGIIAGITRAGTTFPSAGEVIDLSGRFVLPGFIDLHLHGAGGRDVMDGTCEAIDVISRIHARYGTTGFLATTLTAPVEKITDALLAVKEVIARGTWGARVLGVHLEGPFINPAWKGAQDAKWILKPNIEILESFLHKAGNIIKIITLAPEIPGALELADYARKRGIILSIGHSDASYEQARAAFMTGFTHATHLFNAMKGLHHREPGIAGSILLEKGVTAELIADGVHIHPAVLKLVVKVKGLDKIVLVTDSMRATGMPDGNYSLGGLEVKVSGNEARFADGTLAGSNLTMNRAVDYMVNNIGLTLPEAAKLASTNPAKILGLDGRKGTIQVGKDADLVALNPDLSVYFTMIGGEIVYWEGAF